MGPSRTSALHCFYNLATKTAADYLKPVKVFKLVTARSYTYRTNSLFVLSVLSSLCLPGMLHLHKRRALQSVAQLSSQETDACNILQLPVRTTDDTVHLLSPNSALK